jgi:uncharacterized protein YndB with AHSA1/START domain
MPTYQLTALPTMNTQMLIRKPVEEVFEAFTNPDITTLFWFTKSSGSVQPQAELVWEWEMYNVSTRLKVEDVRPNKRIVVTWNLDGSPSTVEWDFYAQENDSTFVTITNRDYKGTPDQVVNEALGSMGGFSFLLAAAKAWLEHGVRLDLVADHHPADLKINKD